MPDDLEKLRRSCAAGHQSDAERLRTGETLWLTGRAAPAERGTIALAQGDLRMIVAEDEVRGVRRSGEQFSVGVGADANVTFRIERTVRVGGLPEATAPCPGCGGDHPAATARARGDIDIGEVTVCKLLPLCITIWGRTYCIRIPYDCETFPPTILT